jgi:hypothetical protein
MGQYFKAVNLDRKEVVCPWCMGGGAKLWEWAANPQGAVFTLLLRKSDRSGGGDYFGYPTQNIELDRASPEGLHRSMLEAFRTVAGIEGKPVSVPPDSIVGRWAGERVVLVGDYDSSGVFGESEKLRNISKELVEVWNDFIEIPEMKLKYNPDCSCQTKD